MSKRLILPLFLALGCGLGTVSHAAPAKKGHKPAKSSTLKIQDLRIGKGKVAAAGHSVTVNYRGTLLNGKMFDQSYGRGPFTFNLGAGEVIKGWDLGVAGMKVGGKRKLTIPAHLAYGANSPSPDIPANSDLIFQVELLKVD